MAFSGVFFLSGCSSSTEWVSTSFFTMDTTINLKSYGASEKLINAVGDIFYQYNDLADCDNAVSGLNNVYTINNTNDYVKVDQRLYDMLSFAVDFMTESEGYYDPFIGSLVSLWKDDLFPSKGEDGTTPESKIPSDEEIRIELNKSSKTSLDFDEANCSVRRNGEGKIDLGGMAKGYVAEVAGKYLEGNDCPYYLLNAGTSSIQLGKKDSSGTNWKIGISNLDGKIFELSSGAVGSSAVTEQLAYVDGAYYSHIVNPKTGSAKVDWWGVTAVGDSSKVMDPLTTVLIQLGPESELSKSLESTYGIKSVYYRLSKQEDGTYSLTELVEHGLEV